MIKEIRKIRTRAKANYIRKLGAEGKIKRIMTTDGYLAYDTEELKLHKQNHKRGRPPKISGTVREEDVN